MGLYIISGTMGGGKSYRASSIALRAWANGAIVHSNIPWNAPEMERLGYTDKHVDLPSEVEQWAGREVGVDGVKRLTSTIITAGASPAEMNYVFLDEAALYVGSRNQAENKKRLECLFEFIVMSRQLNIDVFFISQSAANIDVGIRRVAEEIQHCVDMSRRPGLGPIVALVMGKFQVNHLSPQKGSVMSRSYYRPDPRVYAIYNTHGVGETINIARSVGTGKKTRFSLGLVPSLAVLFVLCCLAYPIYAWSTNEVGLLGEIKTKETPPPNKGDTFASSAPQEQSRRLLAFSTPDTYFDDLGHAYSFIPTKGTLVKQAADLGSFVALQTDNGTIKLYRSPCTLR